MTKHAEITWIAQNGRHTTYERISHVGGDSPEPWSMTIKQAVKLADAGQRRFFVVRDGVEVKVEALTSRTGARYLKTADDRNEPHKLLELPANPEFEAELVAASAQVA
jgi:hypothetical protein